MVGLTVVNGTFLGAAIALGEGAWERAALTVAAIVNVYAFIGAIFLLQTKFRPELQDDPYYSKYISRKDASVKSVNPVEVLERKLDVLQREIQDATAGVHEPTSVLDWTKWKVAINDHLPFAADLRLSLKERGIPVAAIFGKINGTHPIKRHTIAISEEIDWSHVVQLLRVAAKFDFEGFSFWYPVRDAGEDEDVYFGSYGDRSSIPFTDELRALLTDPASEDADIVPVLRQLRQKHATD